MIKDPDIKVSSKYGLIKVLIKLIPPPKVKKYKIRLEVTNSNEENLVLAIVYSAAFL